MRYRIVEWHDGGIVHEETQTLVGRIDRKPMQGKVHYVFKDDDGEVVAISNSLADAFATFAAHEASRPRQWEKVSATEYAKVTRHYDVLSVQQVEDGKWLVFKNDHELVDDGASPVRLASRKQ